MVHDYAEDFLESMKIVAEHCYKDQKFDETIIATVINDDDSKNGRYIVTDGTIKFDAYSDSQTYKVNDVVRVTILKGDYSAKKYIAGKSVVEENGTALTYVSPAESVLVITDNLFGGPQGKNTWELVANSGNTMADLIPGTQNDTYEAHCLWKITSQDEEFKNLQQSSLYDAIVLKAKFKTLLNGYHITSGSYGLWLDLYISTSDTGDGYILKRFYLDSSTMFGNPYNFLFYSEQSAKFNISHTETISAMALWAYQSNDFKYKLDNGNIDNLPKAAYGHNIFISDVYIGMGSDLSNIEDNKLVIYTHDNLIYNADDDQDANNKSLGIVWYNKDDENNYIGFSDGYVKKDINNNGIIEENENFLHYDEIQYLQNKAEQDRLLLEQNKFNIPNDTDGLELAADLTEAKPLFEQVDRLIFTKLYNEFMAFQSQLSLLNDDKIENIFFTWMNIQDKDAEGKPLTKGYFFQDGKQLNIERFTTYYKDALAFAAAGQRANKTISDGEIIKEKGLDQNGNEIEYEYKKPSDNVREIEKLLRDNINSFINGVKNSFLEEIKSRISTEHSNFTNIYDIYNVRIMNIINQIQEAFEKLKNILEWGLSNNKQTYGNEARFDSLFVKVKNNNYVKPEMMDLSQYDNLYCIYWYKYESGYQSDEPFSELNWKRIAPYEDKNEALQLINRGLPIPEDDSDMYPAKAANPNAENLLLPVTLDINKDEEKYRAILIYNHEPFKSNEIVFTNDRPITKDIILNSIAIEHSTNSQDVYPLYGVNNQLLNAAELNKPRSVQVRYIDKTGEKNDLALNGAQIYWYLPLNATMLRYDLADYVAIDGNAGSRNAFTNDIGRQSVNENTYREGYACFYKKLQITENNKYDLQFPYRIKNNFVPTYTNNTIYCVVIKGQVKLEAFISFEFSSFGTNGTNYTLVISPKTSQIGMTKDKAFEFKVDLYDYNHEKVTINSDMACTVKLQTINPYEGNITTNINPVTHPVLQFDANSCMGSVTFGTWARYAYYYVLEAEVKVPWLDGNVTLKTWYPVPYAAESDYYIEGPSAVIYDSFGANPAYYKQSFKLFKRTAENGVIVSEEIPPFEDKTTSKSRRWEMRYYTKKSSDDTTVDRDFSYVSNLTAKLGSYLPVLSKENILIPSPMYLVNGSDEIYIVAIYFEEKKTGSQVTSKILWAQPILLQQNCYPSELLNNWNGKLKIDENGNYLLANMVGAGRKNTDDNTFSGVLMGTIEQTADIDVDNITQETVSLNNDHTGTGLYGFHHGAQSFGFNINGTAFIGKSNGGRIAFDGNHGFIYSQNWLTSDHILENGQVTSGDNNQPFNNMKGKITLNQGTAGMAIDLQTGHIDAYNFKLTSEGIQLNSSPKSDTDSYFIIGTEPDTTSNTASYLKYTKKGDLIVRVNSLELATVVSGPNLLHDTAPNQEAGKEMAIGGRWWSGSQRYSYYDTQANKKSIRIASKEVNDPNDSSKKVYQREMAQVLNIEKANDRYLEAGTYTLSGEVYADATGSYKRKIIFRLGHWQQGKKYENIISIEKNSTWVPFTCQFTIPPSDLTDLTGTSVRDIFHVYDKVISADGKDEIPHAQTTEIYTYFHHLKLEKSFQASEWCLSELDNNENYTNNAVTSLDNSLNRQLIIDRLNLLETDGIYIDNNQLLINATGIKTGILTAKTENMTISLDDGYIWSKNFHLSSTGLEINSGATGSNNKFYIGADNNSYIKYTGNGDLTIKSSSLDLKAWTEADGGVIICTNPTFPQDKSVSSYAFLIGTGQQDTDSFISYRLHRKSVNDDNPYGILRINTSNFKLDADGSVSIMGDITAKDGKSFNLRADDTTNNRTVLLANDPKTYGWQSYFYIGDKLNYIKYSIDDKLIINADNFKLKADGDVEVKGKITATSGVFDQCTINDGCSMDGWTIGSNGIYKKTDNYWTGMYNSWNHGARTIAGLESSNWRFIAGSTTTSKFGITRDGELAASSGKIGGWTIGSNSLYVGTNTSLNSDGTFAFGTGKSVLQFESTGLELDGGNIYINDGSLVLYYLGQAVTLTGNALFQLLGKIGQ